MDRFFLLLFFGFACVIGGLAIERRPHVDVTVPIPFWHPRIALPDGLKVQRDRLQATLDARDKAARTRATLAGGISLQHGETLKQNLVQVRTVTRTLIEKVPIYVTAEDDRRCVVPAGAISLLNAAIRGDTNLPASTASGLEQAASGVPLSALVDNGVYNLGVGHELLKEVLMWRAREADMQAVYALH